MRRNKLDKIDLKILKNLQENGRMTNVELARDVDISAPPCLRRVRALEEHGFIKGYHAHIDAAALGYSVAVFTTVKLGTHAEKEIARFEKFVNDHPAVREAHMIAGDNDFLLKVVAKDWDGYQEFLTQHLIKNFDVASVNSSLCIRSAKNEPGVPVDMD